MKSATVVSVLAVSTLVHADTLFLRNGQVIPGTVLSRDNQNLRFLPHHGHPHVYKNGQILRVAVEDVHILAGSAPKKDDSRSRLAGKGADIIPAGTQIRVRLTESIHPDTKDVGRRYRALLDRDLVVEGRFIAPRGTAATVEVTRADSGVGGSGQVALNLREITTGGRRLLPVSDEAQILSDSRGAENLRVIGGPHALHVLISNSANGGSEASSGIGPLTIRGQKIEIPPETQLLFNLAEPVRL